VLGAGVLGKHTYESPFVFFVERGAERADQFKFRMQVKLVGLRRVQVFDLCAETLHQFIEHDLQSGEQVH
jgi:hypothetical protein